MKPISEEMLFNLFIKLAGQQVGRKVANKLIVISYNRLKIGAFNAP